MGDAFDQTQPGAIRLLKMAREIKAGLVPVAVEVRKPVLLLSEGRRLKPGERTTISARSVEHLVADGSVVRV